MPLMINADPFGSSRGLTPLQFSSAERFIMKLEPFELHPTLATRPAALRHAGVVFRSGHPPLRSVKDHPRSASQRWRGAAGR